MLKTVKEVRKIDADDLRALCIRKNWYTLGTNVQYALMFRMAAKDNLTAQDIACIADDIKKHSVTDYPIESICFEVAEISHSFFEF